MIKQYTYFSAMSVTPVTISAPYSENSIRKGEKILDLKAEVHDIAVLHDVFFALESGEAFFAGGLS